MSAELDPRRGPRAEPSSLGSPGDAGTALLLRAQAHLADGRHNEAARIALVYANEIEPKNPAAFRILSLAERGRKRFEQAAIEASRAVFLAPDDAESRARFMTALRELAADVSSAPINFGARHLLSRMATPSHGNDGAGTKRTTTGIDIVQEMFAPAGTEMRIIETARLLRRHVPTRIWSVGPPHPRLLELDPTIEMVTPDRLPTGETLVIAGVYLKTEALFARLRPRRMILFFNTPDIHFLMRWLAVSATLGPEKTDIAFASGALRDAVGVAGEVLPSPIDLTYFTPRETVRSIRTVGRMSRDKPGKHHPQDPALYDAFIAADLNVDLLGAASVASFLKKNARLTLRPDYALPPNDFLHSLDAFVYRTGTWYETWGRVVSEAMACGLPVICHRAGGYAEIIRHGENGFLFDTNAEAFDQIASLRNDVPTLCRVAEEARQTIVEEVLSPAPIARQIEYFTRF